MTYSCKRTTGPRGRTTTITVQDGYDTLRVGKVFVRVPHMVEVVTEWLPMRCGALQQQGLPRDPNCEGCSNAPRDAGGGQ